MTDHFAEAEMNVTRFIGATIYHDNSSLIQLADMKRLLGTSGETVIITLEEETSQCAVHNIRGGLEGGLKHINIS
jgi:hypothetical protein